MSGTIEKQAARSGEQTSDNNFGLLRLLTCGSVDDGKSTLIGRLLHDTHQIFDDQLSTLQSDSKKQGTTGEKLDLALLVDGLQAEREQGITIDVAYRYFASDKRKFIIADTPGHEQYTRNMATGASNCDLAIILIDARKGVLTQTRRHSYIASMLGIKHFVVAINKMDLIDFSQPTYEAIKHHYLDFAEQLKVNNPTLEISFIPLCALEGDNVVEAGERLSWYKGAPLLSQLERVQIQVNQQDQAMRFPVQYVNRPNLDFRGFCGTLLSGSVAVGDKVLALPSGKSSSVKAIVTFDGDLKEAHAGQAITLTLNDEIDISRGDMLVNPQAQPLQSNKLTATLVWMEQDPLSCGKEYEFKFASNIGRGQVERVVYKTHVNTLKQKQATQLELNEIGQCELQLTQSVAFDNFQDLPNTGNFIVIDKLSNATVAAGMINGTWQSEANANSHEYSEFEIEFNTLVRKHFPHWQAKDITKS